MKITNSLIEEAITRTVGEEAMPIVEYLKGKKNISDFKIADNTKMHMQRVRNILYRLHAQNLITYRRKKDPVKGWYISYFTFNKKAVPDVIDKLREQELEKYRERLSREEDTTLFFLCPNLCVRLDMDGSAQYDFRCPECGALLNQQDNESTVKHLKKKVEELEMAG